MTPLSSEPRPIRGRANLSLPVPGKTGAAPAAPVPLSRSERRAARTVRLPQITGVTRSELRDLVDNVLVEHVVDDSGSEYAGDPAGCRYAAARSLVELQRRSGGGSVGVVHWGSDAPESMAVGPLDVVRDRAAIDASLAVPSNTLGGNYMAAGLRRALEIYRSAPIGTDVCVFVNTDGGESVTAEIRMAVGAFPPKAVHLLIIDQQGWCSDEMFAEWQTVAFGSVTRLTSTSVRDTALRMADVYASALGLRLAPHRSN